MPATLLSFYIFIGIDTKMYLCIRVPHVLKPFVNGARGVARMSNPFLNMQDIFWSGIEKYYMDQGLLDRRHSILKDRYVCSFLCKELRR